VCVCRVWGCVGVGGEVGWGLMAVECGQGRYEGGMAVHCSSVVHSVWRQVCGRWVQVCAGVCAEVEVRGGAVCVQRCM